MSDFVVPDSIEPRIGWKMLSVANGILISPSASMLWPIGARATASCPSGLHDAPDPGCSCGIYMMDTPEQCNAYFTKTRLLAKVAMWGRIVPGAYGIRGEFAYPQKLYTLPDNIVRATTASERYGIPYEIVKPETSEPDVAWAMDLPVPNPLEAKARELHAKSRMLRAQGACFSFLSLTSASMSLGLLLDPPPPVMGTAVGLFGSLAFWAGCDWRRERRRWLELKQE